MLVTNSHLLWWRSKHEPTWAGKVSAKVKLSTPSIHALINAQVRYPHNPRAAKDDTELHNTMHLLRMRSTRMADQFMNVLDLLSSPHSSHRRRVWCARFIHRIRRSRGEAARG